MKVSLLLDRGYQGNSLNSTVAPTYYPNSKDVPIGIEVSKPFLHEFEACFTSSTITKAHHRGSYRLQLGKSLMLFC